MVDIHSHILPGLDDGAETLEQAVAMVRMAAEHGTTDIVATPHANTQFTFDAEQIDEKVRELEQASDGVLRIHCGCDFHLQYDNIQDALEHPDKYTINHKGYLLVEFSDLLISKATEELFFRLQEAGMVPIVTHPERNSLLQQRIDQIGRWVENGALVQVTAQSFLGRFGKRARAFSHELMKRGLVHFIASDAHDTEHRPPVLKEAYGYIASRYGEQEAVRLFVTNPQATLIGAAVQQTPVTGRGVARRWYEFWK